MNENNNTPINNGEGRPRAPRPTAGAPRPQNPAPQARPAAGGQRPAIRPTAQNAGEGRPVRPQQSQQSRPAEGRVQPVRRPEGQAGNAMPRTANGEAPRRPVPQRPQAQGQTPRTSQGQQPSQRPAQRPANPIQRPAQAQPQKPAHEPEAQGQEAQSRPAENSPAPQKPDGAKKKKTTLSKAGAEMMSSVVKAIIYLVAVFVVAIFLSIIIIRVGNDVFALVKSDEAIDITIPEEATINDVGQILHENSIISFPGLFSFYGNLKNDDGVFIAGDYTVSPSMSYDDLRAEFKPKPVTGTSWITIPEGYTVDEIISLMVSYGIGDRETYIDVINNHDFDYWFVKEIPENDGRHYRLEGYLFPDTYEFYNSSSEVTVINKLLARFNEVVVQDYRDRVEEINTAYGLTDENKLTFDDFIIIASLIEKEAGTAADYRYVSSVFHNRLKAPARFPKLESDATTVYAIQLDNDGVRPEDVSAEDIRNYDSPYNTYKNNGLTPGAIANPSASAIRYALYPFEPESAAETYYFFVAGVGGVTKYACTQAEHDANIAEIKQQMAQMDQ